MKPSHSALSTLLVAAICVAEVSGCKKQPEVTDLAKSGWTFAEEAPTATDGEPQTVSGLVAAGWTVTPTSLLEIEPQYDSSDGNWIAFKSEFKPGDEVVRLVAPTAYWVNSAGWDGFAIVRSDTVVAMLVQTLS